MKKISLAFASHCHLSDIEKYSCEALYDKALSKVVQFLFNHPKISFSFYLPPPYLEWISEKHPEFLLIL